MSLSGGTGKLILKDINQKMSLKNDIIDNSGNCMTKYKLRICCTEVLTKPMEKRERIQNKTKILFFNDARSNNVMLDTINKFPNCTADCVLKPVNKMLRAIRRFHLGRTYIGAGVWFLPWKTCLKDQDNVICIASGYSPQVLKWIKMKYPKIRCINYYWDTVNISGYPIVECEQFENWSFHKEDTDKYGFRYNPQFYIREISIQDSNESGKYDFSYVGADRNGTLKDRTKAVKELYEYSHKHGLKTDIYYVTNDTSVPDGIRKVKILPEEDYSKICAKSKAIVELVEEDKKWMTLRSLLALSNKKKLITNNDQIVKEKFYTPDNIFIWGVDKNKNFLDFLNSEFNPEHDEEINYYEFKNWLKRFAE